MSADLYQTFLASDDTLRVYRAGTLIFSSTKDRLLPLVDFLEGFGRGSEPVLVYDKVMGNAAACLAVLANAREVYSPMGSELAVATLDDYGITHHLDEVVPFILQDDGVSMCPMEELSIDKEPEDFYEALKARIAASQ
ncbi:MAG: DUF1893 domain-containing protein [Dehalococcoidales bacterium]|nr:DUF1893 domain-containing protein [Dehalococcoidales bacterium]